MDQPASSEGEPEVVGVPPETPDAVRPSTTGVAVGPPDEQPATEGVDAPPAGQRVAPAERVDEMSVEQVLVDAEGGVEGSLLDVPDDGPALPS